MSDKLSSTGTEDLLVTVHRTRNATAEVTASSQVYASADIRCKFIEALWAGVGMDPGHEQRVAIPTRIDSKGLSSCKGGSSRQLWALGYDFNKNG